MILGEHHEAERVPQTGTFRVRVAVGEKTQPVAPPKSSERRSHIIEELDVLKPMLHVKGVQVAG